VSANAVDFNRDVRPILSDHCFKCHGPDRQRSGLRFDDPAVPIEKKAIVPGDLAASLMIQRTTSDDPEFQMPPPDANLPLSPAQIETLKQWVAEGGVFARHWAFDPVPPRAEPQVADPDGWVRNPIDAFVLQGLQAAELTPSPEASRERLLRRISLDITGLPPTTDEIRDFLRDRSDDAFEKQVDRLLASPAYGENMAVEWLDLARYADTFGYQDDKPNHVWPWRDWVVRAYNENLPYSEFVKWQLAGDLLPSPTQDQLIATAFNRLHRQTNEGGSINEEFIVEYAADRVQTFGTTVLGLTLDCARCHDHKYDPITQRDYYSFVAFFNNIDESGMYSFFTDATPTPGAYIYADGQHAEHKRLQQAVRDAEAKLAAARQAAMARVAQEQPTLTEIALPDPVVRVSFEAIAEGKILNDVTGKAPASAGGDIALVPGWAGNAAHFNGENAITIPDAIDFDRTDPFTIAGWIKPGAGGMDKMVVLHRSAASMDAASRGYEVMLEQGHVVFSLIHFWPGNAIRVRTQGTVPTGEWTHIAVTYDGSSRADGAAVYINGAAAAVETIRDGLSQTIRYERGGPYALTLGARFRDPGFKDGALDELRVYAECLSAVEIAHEADPALVSTVDATDYFVRRTDEYRQALAAAHEARAAEAKFADALQEIMVMKDMAKAPSAHVLARGAYDAPRDEVGPKTPDSVLAFPADYPRNRLGLAEWALRRDNPLTARVAVNRVWKHFFGRGLVVTLEDFGLQGSSPSNQPLLDYLAAWFMDNGWDVKALCKLIVTSATYRQDSTPDTDRVARDPENVLLARGPRDRLSAEQVRDAALAASGLLVKTMGGPGVKPYQPGDLWADATNVTFNQDKGDALYRRTLYTYIKRTVPPPMMTTFDLANRETCIARRESTATPLQALVLLNDMQYIEAARVLAEEVLAAHPRKPAQAIEAVYLRLIGREPSDDETAMIVSTLKEQRAMFKRSPEGAAQYTKLGERPIRDGIDPVNLAAMTAVVQLLMNYDEFQVKL